ncbi:MAG: lysophospholipase [Candidatus Helarchaeota archaeon]
MENNYKFNPLLEKLRISKAADNGKYNFLITKDSTKLFYRYYLPPEIDKIIVVAHGAGGNGDYYVILADQVFNEHIGVYVMDYRGHGYSEGKRGDIKSIKELLSDFDEFVSLIQEKHRNVPIFLFGESMGGALIINYLAKYNSPEITEVIKGVILFSPAIKLKMKYSIKQIFLAIPFLLTYLFAPSARIIDITKGPVDEGIANPIHIEYDKTDENHLKKISPRYLLNLVRLIEKSYNLADKITAPIIIFQGTNDPVIDIDGIEKFYERCSSSDKTLELVDGGRHVLFTDPIANSKENNIWKKLNNWLKNH